MKDSFGPDLIERSLKTTGALLLIFLLPGVYYFGIMCTLAVFFGGVWGMINLIFLSALVRTALRPDKIDKGKVIGLALVKFPLLYLSGYFLLTVKQFEPVYLVAGFSTLLAVMLLKVVARALLGLDEEQTTGAQTSRAV